MRTESIMIDEEPKVAKENEMSSYNDSIKNGLSSYNDYIKLRKFVRKNHEKLHNETWSAFVKLMTYVPPQSYGIYFQKRLIRELNLKETHSNKDKGDFVDHFGDHYELKVSFSTDLIPKMNLVQIRPWQNTNYYFITFVLKDDKVYAYCFKLSHKQMLEEIILCKMSSAHGTKKALVNNEKKELRKTINIDSNDDTFKRWFLNYRSGFFDKYDDIISPETLEEIEFINLI